MEIVKDENPEVKPSAPQYDPNKKYTWGPKDEFILSGSEFGVILNALRAVLSTPDAQRILLAERASEMIEVSLARAVENGVAKEQKEPSK